ncbi:hypothetical protein [Streptomyces sp. NRRL S-378]|uniref:hypothetical protein n=1 Tax=Streptomyces sp. NRRL S-378 TaxID=1463904 RepID=UPI0004C7DE81|nr:hypothetical protein [Streptomyces sp. NRRL S-378]
MTEAAAGAGTAIGSGDEHGAGAEAVREALGDWRRDALLLCLLPVFCWPAVVAVVLTRPVASAVLPAPVLLGPVVLGARELHTVRRVRRVLRDPAVCWVPYEAAVVRARWRPPVVVLGEGRHALTLGVLGRRALPPRPWPRREPAPTVRAVRLAGDPARGGVLWIPDARRLGLARPARVRPARVRPARARPARARPARARPGRPGDGGLPAAGLAGRGPGSAPVGAV